MKKLKINGIVYNQKEDGTLVPETPATPEAPKADEPKVEEPKVESADEPKDEDETKMAGVIAEKLADAKSLIKISFTQKFQSKFE